MSKFFPISGNQQIEIFITLYHHLRIKRKFQLQDAILFKETIIITEFYHLHKTYSSKTFLANNFLQIGKIGKCNENLET